jgi:hypothetical protein
VPTEKAAGGCGYVLAVGGGELPRVCGVVAGGRCMGPGKQNCTNISLFVSACNEKFLKASLREMQNISNGQTKRS